VIAGLRPEIIAKEERTPEIDEVLEGRDRIVLEEELLEELIKPAAGEAPVRQQPLATRIRKLLAPARVKLALTGGKEARQILARDHVKLVQQCVLHNPRLTTEEVLAMAKNRSLHGELLRIIASQRDWVRQYSIRQALVLNPKTPLQMSLSLLPGIQDRDVRLIAKSRNVPTVVQSQARRMLLRKTGGGSGSGSS
jgi:hypothetical protein